MNSCVAQTRAKRLASNPRRVVPNFQLTEENRQSGHPQSFSHYASNAVKSTKYNLINFLPLSIMLQFTKVINCFYFANMILQMIPSVSTNFWGFTAVPLAVIIFIGVLKEGLSDYRRTIQDKKVN